MTRVIPVALVALVVVACGPAEPETGAPTTSSIPITTSTTFATTTSVATSTTTAPEPTTTTLPVERHEIVDGEFQGPESFPVMVGETFEIEVLSDADGELHVHGFDLLFELAADEPTLVTVPASAPGVFEVELEGSHTHLFDIEVLG